MLSIWCSPLPLTKQTVRVLPFRSRMKAPVTPSSVMLLASSFFSPIWTTAVPRFLMPASRATLGILVGIDVLDLHLGREVGVLIEQVLAFAKLRGLIEVGDGGVLLQTLDHLGRLVGEAVTLVGGGIVRLVVTIGENVGD